MAYTSRPDRLVVAGRGGVHGAAGGRADTVGDGARAADVVVVESRAGGGGLANDVDVDAGSACPATDAIVEDGGNADVDVDVLVVDLPPIARVSGSSERRVAVSRTAVRRTIVLSGMATRYRFLVDRQPVVTLRERSSPPRAMRSGTNGADRAHTTLASAVETWQRSSRQCGQSSFGPSMSRSPERL